VDHHLRNIFSQLGVRSRVELALLMNGDRTEPSGGGGENV
jgi:DNA-binding NarL/FixJ family response regulator